jgi:hypothetical protein
MSDDEADAAGAAMANAYAAEFEEEDSDYTALGPPKKKAKTRGKLSEEAGKQAWCLVVKLKFGDMSKIMKLKELFEDYVSAQASTSLPMLCPSKPDSCSHRPGALGTHLLTGSMDSRE